MEVLPIASNNIMKTHVHIYVHSPGTAYVGVWICSEGEKRKLFNIIMAWSIVYIGIAKDNHQELLHFASTSFYVIKAEEMRK